MRASLEANCTCFALVCVGLYAQSSCSFSLGAMGRKSPSQLVSCDFGLKKKQPQPQQSQGTGGHQARQRTFADAVVDCPQVLRRNPSQKSVSTDAGSSSSVCSAGSPVQSEGVAEPLRSSDPSAQEGSFPPPLDLPARVCAPNAPLWVGNGLKGDKGAWLLVLPKFEQLSSDSTTSGVVNTLKSPSDAVLLGPYVTTKNTFLDESRLNQTLRLHQRFRAKSSDGGRSCMRSR